ncbi:conserved exported hypothetical protein [Tenacibaculum sp. 190524A05c]|uniref:hypothetical protein n=1 Tax=Tenacibaculum platacis TaxID=3137852 RepID=UPI0031FA5197
MSCKIKVAAVLSLLMQLGIHAQTSQIKKTQSPIPVETLLGSRSFYYQHVISKNLNDSGLNFFNVSSFDANWTDNQDNHYFITGFLSQKIWKGLSIGFGGEIQGPGSFFTTGLQYSFFKKNLLVVVFPSVNLNGVMELSNFALIEYKPKINNKTSIYLRAQFLATTNFSQIFRSYQQLRAGLQLKNYQFGLAANFDQFNVPNIYKNNFGVFIRTLLF